MADRWLRTVFSLMNSRAGVVFNGTTGFLNYTGSFLANTNYTIAAAVAGSTCCHQATGSVRLRLDMPVLP